MTAPLTVTLPAYGLPDLAPVIAGQQHALLFATVSGAHLYGFPSRDSDVDLRGVHLLPLREVLGLASVRETHARTWDRHGVEMDLVTHDLAKFARLLLQPNGYVLEQLLSPLVAHTTAAHTELVALAPRLLTRHHARHYRGFARTQWRRFEKTGELKPLLYTFRVLLTGIHLMRTQEVLAHLPSLLEAGQAPGFLPDLIGAKAEAEHGLLAHMSGAPGTERLAADVEALAAALDTAEADTGLPQEPRARARARLNELVVDTRLRTG
ncbi:nucleotidyltransferase domain-containing protein [Streptomyces sp. N2-109]|uniref:Nucleotidyltransferase domain-containing protein n=1 Tax=Streptomyces gossypii TaxID=2883101 RepID=A0ABT2JLM9_9ACTN|nr:nucleotidyltransferase domain-containing protein [Streptomyces gossypii]MCT2588409.1 nucleotidyltransferase domain-containing protein [Streptomyces gossypii]